MKKFLLGTSALIGSVAIATAANAAGPSVSVGGSIDFQAGIADQDSGFDTNVRDIKFQNDTEIHVTVEGKSDNGLTYGAVIELEADVSADADGEGGNADKTYIYLESSAGRVELGNNTGTADAMKVDASSIARGTGGVDGDFYDFINTTAATFILTPDLPNAAATGIREDATKIGYYSPRFSGLQVGVSYTPDSGNGGTAAGFTADNNGDQEDIIGLGLNYTAQYDSVAIEASLTGEFGESEVTGIEDLSAWAVGLSANYQGWSVAGSWADWSDSGLATGAVNDDQEFWTLGAAYETGPFGVSVTYLDSESGVAEFNNLVFSADYQLAPGLVPYVEVSLFDLDDGIAGTADNDGSVILVGTELTF